MISDVDALMRDDDGVMPGAALLVVRDGRSVAALGDGGIYSSIDDLAKWDAALYDDRLLRAESLRLALTAATPTDDPGVE